MSQFSTNNFLLYISEMVEDRWVYAATCLEALNSLSNRVTFTAIVPEAYPGETKMCKNGELLNLRVELLGNG